MHWTFFYFKAFFFFFLAKWEHFQNLFFLIDKNVHLILLGAKMLSPFTNQETKTKTKKKNSNS